MLYILAQGKVCPSKADSEGEGLDLESGGVILEGKGKRI